MPRPLADSVANQPAFQQFRKAFAERKLPLVCICGAGLSANADIPVWSCLRKLLEKHASDKVDSLNQLGQQLYDGKLKAATSTLDLWLAFDLLEEILTEPTFRNYIIQYLTPPTGTDLPDAYDYLMRLKPRGLVTLNLDKFAGEAIANANLGNVTTPIYGLELGQKWNSLQHSTQYLVYLHGDLSDPSNWVLTRRQLKALLKTKAHEHFLYELYSRHLVLFVGISVDDVALAGGLLEMQQANFLPPALYWLTPRLDEQTTNWAAENNISLILYQALDKAAHTQTIESVVDACIEYIPADELRPPPARTKHTYTVDIESDDDPRKLAQKDPETIRKVVSTRLQRQLSNCSDDAVYDEFTKFCKTYRYPLNRAFYKDESPEFSKWFDLHLYFPGLGKGNFGEVFLAHDTTGSPCAVKIMHESILSDQNMLGGFRRGVRSMRIMTDARVSGVVPIIDAYELPPTIIMEHVEGTTLEDAIKARPDVPWSIKLSIAAKVAQIVLSGHSLPKTVMHRDLKPSNIMIRNFEYSGMFAPDVMVLDFDMSWHKGSNEKDVVFETRDDFGYLAPEQTTTVRGVSAVNTRVDSYGLGMTLYFLFGGEHPRPNEGLSERWLDLARRAVEKGYDQKWKSAPIRLGRLIRDCTHIRQAERLDFALAVRELSEIEKAMLNPSDIDNPEIFAEEIMALLPLPANYEWFGGAGGGQVKLVRGLDVIVRPDFRKAGVTFELKYVDQGLQAYSELGRRLDAAFDGGVKALERNSWRVVERRRGGNEVMVKGAAELETCQQSFEAIKRGAAEAYGCFERVMPR